MSALKRLGIDPEILHEYRPFRSSSQAQTSDAFSFKWKKRDTYESAAVREKMRQWLFERYCDNRPERLDGWLENGPQIILDAGCGAGFSALLFFGDHLKRHDYLGVDISDSVDVARKRFEEHGYPGEFLQFDLLSLPIPEASVDVIFSEGVLHHTDSVEKSIKYLSSKLKANGLFLFYVYARKADIREFTDDHIRNQIRSLSNNEAWEALKPLTKLGIALGELNTDIDIPEDIPFLGIKRGKVSIQEFFYYNIVKAYYEPNFSLDEMNHINFDWFRPLNCHRHSPDEIETFCSKAGLSIEHFNVQPSGITVVARKT